MLRTVLVWPDDKLTEESVDVTAFDAALTELTEDLLATCAAKSGAGLAAIQVGVPLRVFVAEGVVFVNPILVAYGVTQAKPEGCLSFPGVIEMVERFPIVDVSYFSPRGTPKTLKANGFMAQVIQHEYDHLSGIVLPDRLPQLHRDRFATRYKIARRRAKSTR